MDGKASGGAAVWAVADAGVAMASVVVTVLETVAKVVALGGSARISEAPPSSTWFSSTAEGLWELHGVPVGVRPPLMTERGRAKRGNGTSETEDRDREERTIGGVTGGVACAGVWEAFLPLTAREGDPGTA